MSKKKKKNTVNKLNKEMVDKTIEKDVDKDKDFVRRIDKYDNKKKGNTLINILVVLTIISCLGYIASTIINIENLKDIILALLLFLFTMFFVSVSITNPSKKKGTNILALLILFIYQVLGSLLLFDIVKLPTMKVMDDLVGKSLTSAIEWTTDNKISLEQEYEYSDLIDEYHIIYQDVKAGTKLKKINKVTVLVSEGPNPDKEIILPNMVGWESEDVLKYIEDNHLTNVLIEFVQSENKENTLIEQSKSGNVRRNEEIKLTFSYGEERGYSEVKLADLTNKTKLEALFYLKKYGIKYELSYDFSDKIKRGNIISQSVKAGTMVSITGDNVTTVKVVISKGKKIIIPDFKKMSVTEVTNWIIKNKLKVEFKDAYDESVKENSVISSSHTKGDAVEEGTVITITLSKGKLKMPEFKSLNEFREWASKYNINYEEQHEFSNDVAIGEVIKYSYNKGDTIKNGDTIIVTISDGKKISVPNVKGLSKSEATSKLKSAGLNYSFVYKHSDSVAKGNVISQSISAGSEVSSGTTITVTISNGKMPNKNISNGGSSGNNKPSTPTCDRSQKEIFWIQPGQTGAQTLSATKSGNPKFTIVANFVSSCSNGDSVSGSVCNAGTYDGLELTPCDTIYLTIVS